MCFQQFWCAWENRLLQIKKSDLSEPIYNHAKLLHLQNGDSTSNGLTQHYNHQGTMAGYCNTHMQQDFQLTFLKEL